MNVIIDTAASVNVVNQEIYEKAQSSLETEMTSSKINLYPFLSRDPIECLGKFDAVVGFQNKSCNGTFVVVGDHADCLLGYKTAVELGVVHVANTLSMEQYKSAYPSQFSDRIGKLKDYQLKLHIDESVKPTQQFH